MVSQKGAKYDIGGSNFKIQSSFSIFNDFWKLDQISNTLHVDIPLFAFIIMPYKNHKESRSLFVKEARKLYQKQFIRWYKMTAEVLPLLRIFRQLDLPIPTLYIMGEEDYMFLPAVEKVVALHTSAKLQVLPKCDM